MCAWFSASSMVVISSQIRSLVFFAEPAPRRNVAAHRRTVHWATGHTIFPECLFLLARLLPVCLVHKEYLSFSIGDSLPVQDAGK